METDGASNRKKEAELPAGLHRVVGQDGKPTGWRILFRCGRGCRHEEFVGRSKGEAIKALHRRRHRRDAEPNWCPADERKQVKATARAARAAEARRVTFRDYAEDYLAWARSHGKRSWTKDESRLNFLRPVFGDRLLDEITTADVERFLDSLEGRAGATVNRYRDQLSAMFKRALRFGLVNKNPVTGIPKRKESGGRVVYILEPEETAVRDALPDDLKPLFTVSVHTGLRWSEQAGLRWRDIDALTELVSVLLSKNGTGRQVPMNETARSALMELATRRQEPDNPEELVTRISYRHMNRLFLRAVERAKLALRDAGKDATRLDGYTWHGNRHTFASRLVMRGADLLTVQRLGGWKTLSMVQRYAHLAPDHLRAAVALLDGPVRVPQIQPAPEGAAAVRLKYDSPPTPEKAEEAAA